MESVSELQNYRVSDLKQFLSRNNVDPNSVKRSDKKNGPPRKSDLLGAALLIRADFDDPQKNGPTSPDGGRPRNVFQSGYSPRSARTLEAADADTGDKDIKPRASKKNNNTTTPTTTPTPKKERKRRTSMGWVNPEFLSQLTPKAKTPTTKTKIAVKTPKTPEATASEYSQDFGDEGDHVIHSDYASSTGAPSPSDSDAGSSSVVETDDSDVDDGYGRRRNDDEKFKSQFEGFKAYEIRAWLNKKQVKYDHRAKKKELQALAVAHALYLEANAEDDAPPLKNEKMHEEEEDYAENDDDSVQIVENPVPSARRPSRSNRSKRASRKSAKKNERTETVTVGIHSSRKQRPSTKAPVQDDDDDDIIMEAVDDGENADPESPNNAPEYNADEDEVVDTPVSTTSNVRRRRRLAARMTAPKISMPSMPRVTVTKQGLASMVFAICLVILVILGVEYWEKMNRPFCDLGSHSEFIPNENGEGKKRCAPCPAFANCANGELNCIPNYRVEGRICVEDSKVSDYANYIEKTLIKALGVSKGRNACNSKHQFSFSQDEMKNMFPEANLDTVKPQRLDYIEKRLRLDVTKFEGAFMKAMIKLKNNPEKIHWRRKTGLFEAKHGARTMGCSIRLFIRRHILAFIVLTLVTFAMVRWRIKRYFRRKEQARIDGVYERALEVLREVRLHYSEEDKGDAFMRDTELREELLGRTTAESVKLWAKVEIVLAKDTRVLKSGPRTIKGMPCYVYEWRGNLRRPPSLGSIPRDTYRSQQQDFNEAESRKRLSFGYGNRNRNSASPHQSPVLRYEQSSSPYDNHNQSPILNMSSATPRRSQHRYSSHSRSPQDRYPSLSPQDNRYSHSPQDNNANNSNNNNNNRRNPVPSPSQPSPGYASLLSSWRNR